MLVLADILCKTKNKIKKIIPIHLLNSDLSLSFRKLLYLLWKEIF